MKRLKRKIAFYLTLCMLFTCAIPAYAEEITVPEAAEIPGIAEEASPAEAEYVAAKPFVKKRMTEMLEEYVYAGDNIMMTSRGGKCR